MDGPGGRQWGVRDFEATSTCLDGSEEEDSEIDESERTEHDLNPMENRDRPCQRYALKVSAQKRRLKKYEDNVLHIGGGFRPLSSFSSLVTSSDDCFGGF